MQRRGVSPPVAVAGALVCALAGCARPAGRARAEAADVAPAGAPVTLEVMFSSEMRAWADDVLPRFNALGATTPQGRRVVVRASYAGSVQMVEGIADERLRPHVVSPASSVVVPLLDERWIARHGPGARPVARGGEPLALSPVVVAMWRPMAEALGWPARRVGWADLARLAQDPRGWGAHGHPEWGAFRFGHTHPAHSNSGLIAVLAMHYAAAGRTRGLTADDVARDEARALVRGLEAAVVRYGRSTDYFHAALVEHGPGYLSAAVLYEHQVVTTRPAPGAPPLVCVYPREGTLWADHPYVVLDAPWVGAAERAAAARLEAYLRARPAQERARVAFGLRPADTDLALGAPVDAAHGADPREPQTLLGAPDAATLRAVLDGWQRARRAVDVALVVDRSGSMEGEAIAQAREGVGQFLRALRPGDLAALGAFNDAVAPPGPPGPPASLLGRAAALRASGGTALYDAVAQAAARAEAAAARDPARIHAVVVLSDGQDTDSRLSLGALLARLRPPEAGGRARVFTIGYGASANADVLRRIASRTGGEYHAGDPASIRAVYAALGDAL